MNIVISSTDGWNVYKRCLEAEERGEECIVPFHKVYTTQKTFDYHNNAIERLSKNSFTGMEDQVKYRAVYRRSEAQ